MTAAAVENPYAGQGSVLLDIGGDVGALVVTMPRAMVGRGDRDPVRRAGGDARGHRPHVAVVDRPVVDGHVPSLVFPELVGGRLRALPEGQHRCAAGVEVRGGEVATAEWPV